MDGGMAVEVELQLFGLGEDMRHGEEHWLPDCW